MVAELLLESLELLVLLVLPVLGVELAAGVAALCVSTWPGVVW
jgi:hypothetical protein